MYFSASERLRLEQPDLAEKIEAIDGLVAAAAQRGPVRLQTSFVVARAGCDRHTARVILEALVDLGAMRRRFYQRCPVTDAPFGERESEGATEKAFYCDLCNLSHDRDESKTLVVYLADAAPKEATGPPFDERGAALARAPETSTLGIAAPQIDSIGALREDKAGQGVGKDLEPQVLVVTALRHEFVAAKVMLDDTAEHPTADGSDAIVLGRVPALKTGRHRVALVLLPDMGNNIAAARVGALLALLKKLRHVVMVGIAGGVPNPKNADEHVRLGDVVASGKEGVIQFDMQKQNDGGSELRPRPRPPGAKLLLSANRILADDEVAGPREWLRNLERGKHLSGFSRPDASTDVLLDHRADAICAVARVFGAKPKALIHPEDPARSPGLPRMFIGAIGSSNTVLKKAEKREELRQQFGVRAVEMEGSGVADAAWFESTSFFLVRGICDYCDASKNDQWQRYAALVAAALFRELLRRSSLDED